MSQQIHEFINRLINEIMNSIMRKYKIAVKDMIADVGYSGFRPHLTHQNQYYLHYDGSYNTNFDVEG